MKYLIYLALIIAAPITLNALETPSKTAGSETLAAAQLTNATLAAGTQGAETELKASVASARLTEKERAAKTKAVAAAAQPARSAVELELPEYCRINDKDLNALVEDVMTKDSPRDPVRNNLYIQLEAAAHSGKAIRARIINIRHGHPGDQFHIELYVADKLLFKSGRQDNPIFIGFRVDEVPYSLTCFEDIQ